MVEVEITIVYQCYNLNPQKFELLLHKFFESACLNLDIFGLENKRYNTREWFIAPLDIINQTIELIISGQVLSYRYNAQNQQLEII